MHMQLTFIHDLPNCDLFMYIHQMHHTPMFLIMYTYNDIQTYIWNTKHALHVETSQHDVLQKTDPATPHNSVPSIPIKQQQQLSSYCL